MFVREKTARGHTYLYLVESVREGGKVRQQIVRALGRKDVLLVSGELDRLIASIARHSAENVLLTTGPAGATHCSEETFSRPLFNLSKGFSPQCLSTPLPFSRRRPKAPPTGGRARGGTREVL